MTFLFGLTQAIQKDLIIFWRKKDRLSIIAALDHVMGIDGRLSRG